MGCAPRSFCAETDAGRRTPDAGRPLRSGVKGVYRNNRTAVEVSAPPELSQRALAEWETEQSCHDLREACDDLGGVIAGWPERVEQRRDHGWLASGFDVSLDPTGPNAGTPEGFPGAPT
jgi:hypothetical protein